MDAELSKVQRMMEEERKRGEEYLNQLKYLQADFENFRKRVDRNMRDVEDFSTSGMMKKLLPVLDDLDMAVASAKKGGDAGILEGIAMVQKNLASALQSEGLREIEAVGKPFDPELHEAVERVDGKGSDRDMVVGVIRRGYAMKDKVLRPSMVRVESAARDSGEKEK